MTKDELWKYLIPALRGLNLPETIFGARQLDILLDVNWYENYYKARRCNLTEEAKNLYRALAGPNAQTILKVYRIKRGLDASKENSDNLQNKDHKETSQS